MKRSLQAMVLSAGLAVVPLTIQAQSGPRFGGHVSTLAKSAQPWTLDVETRVARRLDPSLRAERLKAAGKSNASSPIDNIDGSKSPELFLPWEVHRFLLATAFYDDPAVAKAWRMRFANAVPDLNISDDFWTTLEKASSEYLSQQRQIETLSADMQNAMRRGDEVVAIRHRIVVKQHAQCAERLHALETISNVIGVSRFNEFLYRAVAPNLTITGVPASSDKLLFVARGCK